jgi:uncharacterized damage-inducible protein DinB
MEQRIMEPVAATTPEIGRWLWAIEDTRRRTKETVSGVAPALLTWTPPGGGNSINALLYHIALIEADYLYADVLELSDYPADVMSLFPHADRDDSGALTAPPPTPLDAHLRRLDLVRERLLGVFSTMTADDFRRPRTLPEYAITPEWTLHHLMQHEADHRGQIATLRDIAKRSRD